MAGRPSTLAWITVHLVYPLLPVPIEGFIRFGAASWALNFDTFSAATLSMSVGLLSVFINQSIRTSKPIIDDPTEDDTRNGTCALFMGAGIISFVLFGLIVLTSALVIDRQMKELRPLLAFFQGAVFVFWVIPVVAGVAAQRGFKLRASYG